MQKNQKLQQIFNLCAQHVDGAALISFLQKKSIPVDFSEQTPYAATSMYFSIYETKIRVNTDKLSIALNKSRPVVALAESLLHEARHVQQAFNGAAIPAMRVSPDDLAWFTRITEADAEATAALIAFKMKVAGFPEIFDSAKKEFPHTLKIYETAEIEYAKNPRGLDTPDFKRKLFDAWFLSGEKQRYDTQSIQRFSDIDAFCNKMPKQSLTRTDVEKIGQSGKESVNYLALPGFRPLDDAYYREIKIDNPWLCLQRDSLLMVWKMTP